MHKVGLRIQFDHLTRHLSALLPHHRLSLLFDFALQYPVSILRTPYNQ